MNFEERQAWKKGARQRVEAFVRRQVAVSEQIYGPFADPTRPERLEEIRKGVKSSARAYWKIMVDPFNEEQFTLALEVFDGIIDEMKHLSVN
ncbi:MAG TPA: hypothetical protein VJ553_07150 [Candidatus Paceibacterota bacterium]|nr:hypothetical protein [Candidatus Paceibacterota bacterium]